MNPFPVTSLVHRVQNLIVQTFDVSLEEALGPAAELVAFAEGWGGEGTAAKIDWNYRIKKDFGGKLRWRSEIERAKFEEAQKMKEMSYNLLIEKRNGSSPI